MSSCGPLPVCSRTTCDSSPIVCENVGGPPSTSAQYAASRSVWSSRNPCSKAWLTTGSARTRWCQACATASTTGAPPIASYKVSMGPANRIPARSSWRNGDLRWPRSAVAVDERHRLGAGGGVGAEAAAHRGGDGAGAGLLDPAHGHAEVLGLDHDDHAAGLEDLHEGVGDLGGQPLLHLGPLGVDVDQPGQLGQPGHLPALGRDVSDMGHARERHQVVLAHRPQLDVADQDQLVVVEGEDRGQHVLGGRTHPGRELLGGAGDPPRRLAQPLAPGVLTDRDEQLSDGRLGARVVERGYVGPRRLPVRHVGPAEPGAGGAGVSTPPSDGFPCTSPPAPGGVTTTPPSPESGEEPLRPFGPWPLTNARRRISSGISTAGIEEGLRSGEPVHAGRSGRRRSGSKTFAICSLSRVSLSRSSRTSESRTSRFSSRMSKASWWAVARSFLVSSSTIPATS